MGKLSPNDWVLIKSFIILACGLALISNLPSCEREPEKVKFEEFEYGGK